jgi:tetratricopeptide (TPR) repeat protein
MKMKKIALAISLLAIFVPQSGNLVAQTSGARSSPASAAAPTQAPRNSDELSALNAAEMYERLGEFEKAEEQFLVATRASNPSLQGRALAGLERAAESAREGRERRALAVAEEYERQKRWNLAGDAYADAVKTGTGFNTALAIDGLRRIHGQLLWEKMASDFDAKMLWLGRVAGVSLVLWWAWRVTQSVWTVRRSIKVYSFVTQSDEASKQIIFWLAYARAGMRGATPTPGTVLMVSYNLPLVDLPGFPSDVPEVEDPTLGDTKLPLKDLFSAWGRPRIRVTGGWISSDGGGQAYAEVERRQLLRRYAVRSTITKAIRGGASQVSDLELFSYDVLIRATQAHGR